MGGSGSGSPARLWSSCRLGPQSSDGWAGAEGPFPRASTCSLDGPGSLPYVPLHRAIYDVAAGVPK